MKKIIIWLLLLASTAGPLKAQKVGEWFNQKQTQTKYLLQQVAALQIYIGYAKKGYNIAKDGLNTIGGFTRGELNLHTDYLNSLKSVNPEFKRHWKVADIIALQIKIVQNYNRSYRQINSSNAFSGDEVAYIGRVFGRLLDDCGKTLDELITITTDSKLEMKDNERIKRIDNLHLDMSDKFTFSKSFSTDIKSLAASKAKEITDIQTGRVLHGLKND